MPGSGKQKVTGLVALAGAFIVLIVSLNSFVIVKAGHVGVVANFGAVQSEILPEGLHMVIPIRTTVYPVSIRIQKIEGHASASSKDLQVVTSKVALNFQADKAHANTIFQKLGRDYRRTIIEPRIQEAVKSATATFTAEQLITERQEVRNQIFTDIKRRLKTDNILVTDLSIIDFSFSPEFNRAIEEKQVAEQSALTAKNDLVRITTEAEQVRAKARGEAEAQLEIAKAEAEAQKLLKLTLDDKIIKLRAIEKWDGELPLSLGKKADGPFFEVFGPKVPVKNE